MRSPEPVHDGHFQAGTLLRQERRSIVINDRSIASDPAPFNGFQTRSLASVSFLSFLSVLLMRLSPFLLFGLLALATRGDATHLQLSGRLGSTSPDLERRTSMTGTLSQLADSQNLIYSTNVAFNGAPFSVMIDTGRYHHSITSDSHN